MVSASALCEDGTMRSDMEVCPICAEIDALPVATSEMLAVTLPDARPVTEGHVLVVPTGHALNLSALSSVQRDALFARVADEVRRLEALPGIGGVNIGINLGAASGQTVAHLHVHVIPRREGDCADPRGGVRCVIEAPGDGSDQGQS
jgi:diadenosine tetraphosphate (Ap4A) HIT family hydrolase